MFQPSVLRFARKLWLAPLLFLLLAMGMSAHAAPTVLKIGWPSADSPSDPYAIAAHTFAEELEKLAPGQYKVEFFGSNQLGDEAQMVQSLRIGSLQMGVLTMTPIGKTVASFQLNDLPFLYSTADQAYRVLDGRAGEIMTEQLAAKGIIGLGFVNAGFRYAINNVRPITKPEDMAGIKFRVQPSPIYLDAFKALGANPVPMAWSDVFTATQQGAVDGLEIPLAVIYTNKFPEITKYLSLTRHTINTPCLVMSGQTFKKLSEQAQNDIRTAGRLTVARQREAMEGITAGILQKLKDAGMQVNDVEDSNAFRDRVTGIYEQYRSVIGSDVLDAAMAEVKK